MTSKLRAYRSCIAAAIAGILPSALVHADIVNGFGTINGFGDFTHWTINHPDGASAPTITPGTIHLTNLSFNERRSVFYNDPVDISGISPHQWTASFTWQAIGTEQGVGASFVLENDPTKAQAVGYYGSDLGYAPYITKSEAITLELGTVSNGSSTSGSYTNGALLGGSQTTGQVNLRSTNPIDVTLTYNGSTLIETLVDDTDKTKVFGPIFFPTNLTASNILGASTAYIGVTASTNNGIDQYFSNFYFSNAPEPASLSLLALGSITLCRRRRQPI